jgi:hypothetical protein
MAASLKAAGGDGEGEEWRGERARWRRMRNIFRCIREIFLLE